MIRFAIEDGQIVVTHSGSKKVFKKWFSSINNNSNISRIDHYDLNQRLDRVYYIGKDNVNTLSSDCLGNSDKFEKYCQDNKNKFSKIYHFDNTRRLLDVWCDDKDVIVIDNSYQDLDLLAVSNYTKAIITNNNIKKIELINIDYAIVHNNKSTKIKHDINLKYLDCHNNNLSNIDTKYLETLICHKNNIQEINISNIKYLKYDFHINGNVIKLKNLNKKCLIYDSNNNIIVFDNYKHTIKILLILLMIITTINIFFTLLVIFIFIISLVI